jgi:D-methionine transport system substrate-binding protein
MSDATVPVLPEKPRPKFLPWVIAAAVVVVGALVTTLVLTLRGGGDDVVRIGTTDISQPHWQILKELAAEEGIEIELVGFAEYTQPNPALKQGELDLNSFQHILYLADHNNNTGDNLQPIGSTLIVPLPLYSNEYDTVDEFRKGDEVAIPNDATNQARALFVLEAAGLISFTGDPKVPTPDDIDTAASTVTVVPVEASQSATLIDQLAGVVVNNNFATDAGFDLDGFVYADDPTSPGAQPYINIFAARPEDVDNPTYQRIVELYHDPSVLESVVESSGGTAVIVGGYDGPRLREVQAQVEQNLKDAAS